MGGKGWEEVELGQLIGVKHGFAFKGEYFKNEPPGDILLTPGNFAIGGGFKYDKLKYYDGPVPEDYVLNAGDLLVTMTDLSKATDTLGYPAIVPGPENDERYLHNQRLGLVQINEPERLHRRFLYYLMCSRPYRHDIIAGATGTTVKHTSPTKIKRFCALIPPFPEQRVIASILGSLDEKIELNRQINRTLEAMARAIFKAWFVDFEPVKAKAAGATSLRGMPQALFDQLPDRFTDTELGTVPEAWEMTRLSDLVELIGGGTPKRKVSEYWDGDIPWFSVRDAPNDGAVWVVDTEEKITKTGVENSSAKVMRAGTSIISARGTVGRLALAAVPMSMNQSCYGVIGKNGVGDFFVYFTLQHGVGELQQRTHGSVFDTITRQTFDGWHRGLPQPEILAVFEEVVSPYLMKMRANLFENGLLANIRDTLLPKLISGELRVSVAEEGTDGG